MRICNGAQNAGRRPADRRGRDRRRASPASVSDRWRTVAGRHGCTPVGCQSRASNAGIAIGRFEPLLSLYAALSPVVGAIPTSAGRIGSQATDGRPASTFGTTVTRRTNATNSNTNVPNDDQSVLASASGASQSASRIPVDFASTPHALKPLKPLEPLEPD